MTEIEIEDEPDPGGPEGPRSGTSPYQNLLVPLVVVPALIVMVLVLVFVLFGAIAGKESTPTQNIDRLLDGGANEREQAAFNLVRQVIEDWQAEAAGERGEWTIDESLLPRVRSAWEQSRRIEQPGDVPIPLALTIILAHTGDPEGVAALAEMTRLPDSLDPEGVHRTYAAFALGAVGDRLAPPEQLVGARALIELLDGEDQGLRSVGVISLQTLPSAETIPALQGMLAAESVELRLNAALSLARLGDPSGAAVLREMVELAPYAAEHAVHPAKWASQERVGESRRKALAALEELGLPPAPDVLRRLADEDQDPLVRELALQILDE